MKITKSYIATCLNATSLEPIFMLRIDRCLFYTG